MRLLLSTLVLLTASFVTTALAQEKLSAADEQEVRSLVTSFNRQILQTRDLTPYLNTLGANVMVNAWSADSDLLSRTYWQKRNLTNCGGSSSQ